jgi:hypothetical protein
MFIHINVTLAKALVSSPFANLMFHIYEEVKWERGNNINDKYQ